MLELPATSLLPEAVRYQAFAAAYLPAADYAALVTGSQQKQLLHEKDKRVSKENFYFLTDVGSGNVIACNGLQRWLGYPDRSFSIKKFVQMLHPSHATAQAFYAAALHRCFLETDWPPVWNRPLFSAALVVKAPSGKYWYGKRDCYPFQFNAHKKITGLLHDVTLIKEYEGEWFWLRLNAANPKAAESFYKYLKKLFEDYGGFSSQEYRMLYKYTGAIKTSSAAIANAFGIKKSTVDTYNQRILRKTETCFHHRSVNAGEAAAYFKRLQFL